MKTIAKIMISLLGMLMVTLLCSMNGGCGEVTTTYFYYYPDWTPDGRIICSKNKQVRSSGTGTIGGSGGTVSNYYTLTIMDADGSNEKDIKVIENGAKVAASPLGNYYAYSCQVSATNYIIKVVDKSGAEISTISSTSEISGLDWSPDETKLVYEGTREVFMIDRSGNNKIVIANFGASVAWRNGRKIILAKKATLSGSYYITALNSDTLSEEATYSKVSGGEFNISRVNTNEVVFRSKKGIEKFFLSSPEADSIMLFNKNDLVNIRLSPDGQKIIANGIGTSYTNTEIWLINIDGTGLKQIR